MCKIDLKFEITDKKEKVCEKCKYINRPFRKELNDTVYCPKTLKFVELVYSCDFFEKF